jgi:archaellum component FlaG (FlaF/FlaG flagellin family)
MHHHGNGLRINKRAVGSIVGAAFFLMIFFTGYMYYTLSNQVTIAQQRTMGEISSFDLDRSQEAVDIIEGPTPVSGEQAVTVMIKNIGPKPLTIVDIGFSIPGDSEGTYQNWEYATNETLPALAHVVSRRVLVDPINEIWIAFKPLLIDHDNPCVIFSGETLTFEIKVTGIDVNSQSVKIQFLTERGRIF